MPWRGRSALDAVEALDYMVNMMREHVPQGHKVALVDLPEGAAVRRYDVPIGYALGMIHSGLNQHSACRLAATNA